MTLTIKESSQLDSSTKTATASSESNSGQNTRSNPVCLEVPVTVRSLPAEKGEESSGPAKPIREEARTVIVFDNGAVLRLAINLPAGQAVIVSNPQGREVVCRVVSARNLPTVKGYMEVEFVEPVNDFWGIHQTLGKTNVSNPPATVAAQPRVVPSEPLPGPPAPSRGAPTVAETIAPAGNAPSFEDVKGAVRMISPPPTRPKVSESTPRIRAAKDADAPARGGVRAASSYSSVSTSAPAGELTSLSGTWEGSPDPVRKPSSPGDFPGKGMFSSAELTSAPSSSESRGRGPLIIVGTVVLLAGLSAGWFFMRPGTVATPVTQVPVASRPTAAVPAPAHPPATSVPEPTVVAQETVDQAPPLSPAVSTVSSVSTESVAPPAPPPSRAALRPASKVDAKQPDPPARRPQAIPELKMSAPTAESRNAGRLVDGSVPNIAEVASTNLLMATPAGAVLPPVARTDNPPAPPVVFAGAGPPVKAAARDARLISSTRPMYPAMAKQTGLEGDVVVSAEVDAAGKVVAAKAIDGPMILRQAAVDAVRGWKYEPAIVNGKPSSSQVTVKIQFRLR